MNSDFTSVVCDDPEHEDLIGELTYKNEFFCLMSQEQGFDMLEIEIYARETGEPWRFKLSQLEEAISKARQRLLELRKEHRKNL